MSKLKNILFLLGICPLLAGCFHVETPEERMYRLRGMCYSYGFKEGTDEFAKCVQKQSMHEQEMHQREQESWERERSNREIANAISTSNNNNESRNFHYLNSVPQKSYARHHRRFY